MMDDDADDDNDIDVPSKGIPMLIAIAMKRMPTDGNDERDAFSSGVRLYLGGWTLDIAPRARQHHAGQIS